MELKQQQEEQEKQVEKSNLEEGSPYTINLVAYDDGTPVTPILVDAIAVNLFTSGTGTTAFSAAAAGAFGIGMPFAVDAGDGVPLLVDSTLASLPALPGALGNFSYFGAPTLLSITTAAAAALADTFDVMMSFDFTATTAGISLSTQRQGESLLDSTFS
eukprot:TRINITY_DN106648_c0_g1_i2.p1 TRINITY_DN106648_c0_g1~~TRINITY_DN106648_c0_g1_i2.p1  ORF type:complete len:159 (-),score=26.11 TRINITY_DN106648_c0_g1_i2:44-520(-)